MSSCHHCLLGAVAMMSLLRDWSGMIRTVLLRTPNNDLGLKCLQCGLGLFTAWLSGSILLGQTCPDWVVAGRKGKPYDVGTMSTPFVNLVVAERAKFLLLCVSSLNGRALRVKFFGDVILNVGIWLMLQ